MDEIRARIDAYFKIVVKNVRDTVPKTIGFFLVRASQDKLQFELYNQVTKSDAMASALGEPQRVTEERNMLTNTLKILKNSIKVLQRDPDLTNTAFGEDEL